MQMRSRPISDIRLEKSRAIAVQELLDDLPNDISTPDNVLLCIEAKGHDAIGYLWYKLLDNAGTAFIMDFVLFDEYRGLGYGKAALIALEQQLSQSGVEQIKLRVAANNKRAFGLYDTLGFSITGYNMAKILE